MLGPNRTFKLTDIVKIFDVKRHFIINLVETGVIKPLIDAKGRGKSRRYSYNNILEIGIFIYLNKLDLSYEMARRVLNKLSEAIKNHPKRTIETVPYIGVFGFLNGKIKIDINIIGSRHIDFESFVKESLPGHYLMGHISTMIEEKKVNIHDFAYYFILDVRNISSYIHSRIE